MSQVINDLTTIKLFGTTIFLTHNIYVSTNDCSSKLPHEDFSDHSLHSSVSSSSPLDEIISQQTTEDLNTPSAETEASQQSSTKLDEQSDMSQDKSPKKPDIVVLVPCPRCKSMDTKFCYYNNYNVKQPRHFCKNCQRYWTSGGTARKMLVGAGRRRKNKATSNLPFDVSQYPQMSTVLTFGSKSSNIVHYGGFLQPLWNVQSIPTQSCGPSNPTLGKHSRDDTNEGLIPKLLRFDEPKMLQRVIYGQQ